MGAALLVTRSTPEHRRTGPATGYSSPQSGRAAARANQGGGRLRTPSTAAATRGYGIRHTSQCAFLGGPRHHAVQPGWLRSPSFDQVHRPHVIARASQPLFHLRALPDEHPHRRPAPSARRRPIRTTPRNDRNVLHAPLPPITVWEKPQAPTRSRNCAERGGHDVPATPRCRRHHPRP